MHVPHLRRALRGALIALALATTARPAMAQRTDSATVVRPRPPITPRRAFLYSFLLPGYSQFVLGRPTAGGIFVTAEAITLTMLRESQANLRDARRFRGDSIVLQYVDPATGNPLVVREGAPGDSSLVRVRKSQVEDWIAAIVATHFFAGLDAYVAAHLWDVPVQLSARPRDGGAVLAARLRF